jgi:hypothetical protein
MAVYTSIDDPSLYFRVKTYSGSSSDGNAITWDETHANMSPNFLWLKNRTASQEHWLCDTVRGTGKFLESNSSNAESSDGASGFASFDSNGFTLNDSARTNRNTMVAWGWKAGTAFTNDASATSVGTLDSAGSSSQTAGFSIVSYTGNASSSQSVAHNLGAVPHMIISKNRDNTSTHYNDWIIYHHSLPTANDKKLKLNTYDPASTTNEWGDTDPTSTVYSVHTSGDGATNDGTDKIISYCFRSIQGYSSFSSFYGNGNTNGVFVPLSFAPQYVMFKKTTGSNANWQTFDAKRNSFNPRSEAMHADDATTPSTDQTIDFLSNGFKLRSNQAHLNEDGVLFVYAAFASAPLTNSKGVPCNAV